MQLVPRHPVSQRLAAGVSAITIAAITAACSAGPASQPPVSVVPTSTATAADAGVATPAPSATATPAPSATTSPAPTASATAASETPVATITAPTEAPPVPAGLVLAIDHGATADDGTPVRRYTVTWTRPLEPGATVRVFGITTCPNPPTPDGVPCVTADTRLPAKIRTRLASSPAESGSASWDWPDIDADGPFVGYDGATVYFAVVLRAVNAAGASRFVVLQSATSCRPDLGGCMS